jgi:hypothetical protein
VAAQTAAWTNAEPGSLLAIKRMNLSYYYYYDDMRDGTCIMDWVSKRLYFLSRAYFDLIVYDLCWGARSSAMHCLYRGPPPCGKGTSFMEHWREDPNRYLISTFFMLIISIFVFLSKGRRGQYLRSYLQSSHRITTRIASKAKQANVHTSQITNLKIQHTTHRTHYIILDTTSSPKRDRRTI